MADAVVFTISLPATSRRVRLAETGVPEDLASSLGRLCPSRRCARPPVILPLQASRSIGRGVPGGARCHDRVLLSALACPGQLRLLAYPPDAVRLHWSETRAQSASHRSERSLERTSR